MLNFNGILKEGTKRQTLWQHKGRKATDPKNTDEHR